MSSEVRPTNGRCDRLKPSARRAGAEFGTEGIPPALSCTRSSAAPCNPKDLAIEIGLTGGRDRAGLIMPAAADSRQPVRRPFVETRLQCRIEIETKPKARAYSVLEHYTQSVILGDAPKIL